MPDDEIHDIETTDKNIEILLREVLDLKKNVHNLKLDMSLVKGFIQGHNERHKGSQ